MFAPCFTETFEQGIVVGIQEDYLAFDCPRLERVVNLGKLFQVFGDVACVDADCDLVQLEIVRTQSCGQGIQQAGRNIINTVVTDIFEHMQASSLSGTGTAADDDEFHAPPIALPEGMPLAWLDAGS